MNYTHTNGLDESIFNKETTSLYRFNVNSSTCYGSDFDDIYTGFSAQFAESDCYTFVIQFIIVTLMYTNVGRGKYWLLLFLASLAGVCGAFIENGTLAVICQVKYKNPNGSFKFIPSFLVNEIFWISNEFSVPILNLIKMQAFSKERLAQMMKYPIMILIIPYIIFRFMIGYYRMTYGYLLDTKIRALHAGAFTVMAIADILCTISILHFVRKSKHDRTVLNRNNDIKSHVKRSSYTTLIIIDIACVFLCTLELVTDIGPLKDVISSSYVVPFRCIKDSFALILATDALIFKYEVNIESSSGSNGYSGSYGYQKSSGNNFKYSTSNNDTKYSTSKNGNSYSKNKYGNDQMASITPYNYPTFDMEAYSKSPGKNKSIIKNYSNIKTSNLMDDKYGTIGGGNKSYDIGYNPNKNFGFLN
ncbi:hypothetical protein BCR32DRAFT_326017 [Anaeromyces robustus]|jgi:hypothetical protein|uniref:Uncharacterized protein n=1 Tax=Anaeromyces robustus TaxID=1754192 RepID=A0A1Y1XEW4_9FUNG|nr:hypothetical protein BCR32DRAFT_326017 [Anaeromyces robustus]|eukprot:ORX84298.1 hypothetical protein BCR32DRAFT_326017 [Anaeromyces robustus]